MTAWSLGRCKTHIFRWTNRCISFRYSSVCVYLLTCLLIVFDSIFQFTKLHGFCQKTHNATEIPTHSMHFECSLSLWIGFLNKHESRERSIYALIRRVFAGQKLSIWLSRWTAQKRILPNINFENWISLCDLFLNFSNYWSRKTL